MQKHNYRPKHTHTHTHTHILVIRVNRGGVLFYNVTGEISVFTAIIFVLQYFAKFTVKPEKITNLEIYIMFS